jgi:hypothetical protein
MNFTSTRLLIDATLLVPMLFASVGFAFAPDRTELEDGQIVEIAPAPNGAEDKSYYLNGMDSDGWIALWEAERIQARLGGHLALAFVDCSRVDPGNGEFRDLLAVVTSKLGDFDTELNAAVDTLLPVVMADLEAGRTVNLIGYSLGGSVAQNLVNELRCTIPTAQRRSMLGRVRVLLIGAACFGDDHPLSDGWPAELGGRFSISDVGDPVTGWWGDVDDEWVPQRQDRHYLSNYLPWIEPRRLALRGRLVTDGPERLLLEEVLAAPRPEDVAIRVRAWSMPDESSRRTIDFRVPRAWGQVGWEVVAAAGNDVDRIRFTWMTRDATLWFDEAAVENLFSGSYCGVADADYLGRVDFAGGGDFVVEAKPYREGP